MLFRLHSFFSLGNNLQVLCNTGGLREIPTKRLPASVENLSLTKNNFPIIKSDAFAGLRNLKKLSLDGNNITTIKPFAFRGLPKIREISIQHTPLATVAQFAFAGLQNITTILLSHNKILRVETNAFAGTSNVKLILLSNNPMLKIETSAFSGLTHVEHLILPSGIRIIEPDAFYSTDSVGLLKLAFMDLTELSPFTFRGLTNVQVLSLQESDLGIICSNSFDGLSHVGTLKFLNNKIDSIEELNLTVSHHIKHLIFHGNHLLGEFQMSNSQNVQSIVGIDSSKTNEYIVNEQIVGFLFAFFLCAETPDPGAIILDGIRNISVINNHFPCGCHVHTLLDSPLSNGSYQRGDFLSRNYCISPLDVNGKAMSELDLFAIGRCQEQVTRENLESNAISLHSNKQRHYRIYACATAVLLLMLINGLHRNGERNANDKYVSQGISTSNQTEIYHNDVRKNVCRLSDRMVPLQRCR